MRHFLQAPLIQKIISIQKNDEKDTIPSDVLLVIVLYPNILLLDRIE
jgi:hypothetical protein